MTEKLMTEKLVTENLTDNLRTEPDKNPRRHNRPVSSHLHPLVHVVMVGLVLWFVALAWIFFGRAQYMGLLLVMVSGLFFMAMAIPSVLWLV